jgi:opacity protein-like surface antigen
MKRSLTIPVLLLAASVPAGADFVRGSQTLAVGLGAGGSYTQYDYQVGKQRNVTGGGGAFGGQYLYYVTDLPAVGVGVDLTSSLNGDKREDDLLNGIDTTARLKSLVGLVMARLSYPRGRFRPYIFAGIGAHHSSQQLSGRPLAGNSWAGGGNESRMLVDERETSAALGYGVGIDMFATENIFFGAEVRGIWLIGLDTDDTAALRRAGFTSHSRDDTTQGNVLFRIGTKF